MTDRKVQVYWNIRLRRYSVVDLATGRVIPGLHPESLVLQDAVFVVRRAGRERVLREGRKNVHAFVRGVLVADEPAAAVWRAVSYNPYREGVWTDRDAHKQVVAANFARLTAGERPSVHYDAAQAHVLGRGA